MSFVGRAKEIGRIWSELRRGYNVVLRGRYGMGRTSLMRHIAEMYEDRALFVFADLSKTGDLAYRTIFASLLPGIESRRRVAALSYRTVRRMVLNHPQEDARPCIVVLDNIARISSPKLNFIRDIALAPCFSVVAVVEASVAPSELERLRVRLNGATLVDLDYLSPGDSRELFRQLMDAHRPGWIASDYEGLLRAFHGYPLGMVSYWVQSAAGGGAGPSGRTRTQREERSNERHRIDSRAGDPRLAR